MKLNLVVVSEWPDGSQFAVATQTLENINLVCAFSRIMNHIKDTKVSIIHACPSFKKARELANAWNDAYEKNGTLHDFAND